MEQIARTSKQIGEALRRERRRIKMSQLDLANKTNLRQSTISSVENGDPGAQLRTILEIITALDLELLIRPRSEAPTKIEDIF
jgi:HTH-type transcriptional regulator / antitoxin HipB